ncbi:MAG: heavy-metal-associated domain-containing protein [Rhodocyclaceae bacterium]|nr:heavy-metal-associated domain-containing protein [Rhodocyclaceae bacterium]
MNTARFRVAATILSLAQLFAAPGAAIAEAPAPATVVRHTLHVEGMVGDSCPVLITAALRHVDGIHHVEASYATRSATVEYDPGRIGLQRIRRTILRQAGFETTVAQ